MKTERKMLISIALIFIMLLNCIMPIFTVYATTADGIVLNSKLYEAIKTELTEQAVVFEADDRTRAIKISADVIAAITRLDLNNYGISDLTGLENFTALNHLELSGNNLSKDSNLAAIANLPLNYLDLSTNNLEDISAIDGLIGSIRGANGTVVLSNQTVTIIKIVEQGLGTTNVAFPQILKEAGFIKALWKYGTTTGPMIDMQYSTGDTLESIDVTIGSTGLLAYQIYIHDDATEAASAANLNRADTNPLKESKFTIYVAVRGPKQTGIHLPDSNLYKEVKRQLTPGMLPGGVENSNGNTFNSDLSSYPYKVDFDGEILYDNCTYTYDRTTGRVTLYDADGNAKYTLASFDADAVYDYDTGAFYTRKFESAIIPVVDEATGTITYKSGYKVALNGGNELLYAEAYDAPQILIIDNNVLMNKISSLLLNNKQIRDLTGLEWFVGLKSSLDVSQNYLSDIDPVYNLQGNKDGYQTKLQEEYNYVLKNRPETEGGSLTSNLAKVTAAKADADKYGDDILKAVNSAINKIADAAKINKEKINEDGTTVPNPDYTKNMADAKKAVEEILKVIENHSTTSAEGETTPVKGYTTLLKESLNEAANNLGSVYGNLIELYDIYNNEYKLLTLLTDDMNYMDFPEYITYKEKLEEPTGLASLVSAQMSKLVSFESSKSFTEFEEAMLEEVFGVDDFDAEERDYTLAKVVANGGSTSLENLRKIALYSEMANYCLVKRMNDSTTAAGICYCEEYLKSRIKEFKDDGIDTELEESVLESLETYAKEPTTFVGDQIFEVYKAYMTDILKYTDATLGDIEKKTCEGEYERVTGLSHENTAYADIDDIKALEVLQKVITEPSPDGGLAYPDAEDNIEYIINNIGLDKFVKEISLYEYIKETYKGEANKLYLFEEAITISTRFINSNVSRYVYLPKLKKLDISHNADLSGVERLGELTYLRELNASSNYISNISNTNWSAITYLRRLYLANNFITDITPVENLKYLETLDVSKNLLSGALNFNFTASQEYLKNFDLSYNQLEDISVILKYLNNTVGANFANYLARPDTLNINLNNQDLEIVVDKMAFLPENPETVNVDLPIIFTQLLAIDANRTTFGLTSLDGRIESEGKFVTLNTRTLGDKTGTVSVIAEPGYDTCIGAGTTATVKYKVADRTVSEVKVTPTTVEMGAGETQTFTAEVIGENLEDTSVNWTISGNTSASTTIDTNGKLTLGADETATNIVVTATSNYDNTKSASAQVTVVVREVTKFEIDPMTATIIKGEGADFKVTIEGNYLRDEDKLIDWVITPEKITNEAGELVDPTLSPNTVATINNNVCTLSVGADEQAEKINITATSKRDNTKIATATVTLVKREVKGLTLTPDTARVETGKTQEFTAELKGAYLDNLNMVWSIEGSTNPNTKLEVATSLETVEVTADQTKTDKAILTISEDETAEEITIKVMSDLDNTKVAEAKVDVFSREVTEVVVPETTATVETGKTMTFTATVNGNDLEDADKEIIWSVSGNKSTDTKINEEGILTVAEDEKAEKLIVTAKSKFDNEKLATIEVTLFSREVSEVVVTPNTAIVKPGETQAFTAAVNGNHLEDADKTVTWSISGNKLTETNISEEGVLTVAAGETAEEITVTATSNFDNTKVGTVKVTVPQKKVNEIVITPNTATVVQGETAQFTAEVKGENLEDADKEIVWSVEVPAESTTSLSTETKIDASGKLTVAENEPNKELIIKATSKIDNTKVAIAKVTVKNAQPSVGLGYKVDEDFMLGVETKLPVEVFKSQVVSGKTGFNVIVKTDGANKQEVTSGNIKTGMWVYIYDANDTELTTPLKDDNGNLLVYQIAVKGDINSDGVADDLDSRLIKAFRNEVTTLTDVQKKAADINADGDIDVIDSKLLLYHRAEVKNYMFDYVAK